MGAAVLVACSAAAERVAAQEVEMVVVDVASARGAEAKVEVMAVGARAEAAREAAG